MSIQPRFYAPVPMTPGAIVPLPDDEAAHLTRVMRLSAGDAVRVFDGQGHEFDAVVESAGRSSAAVRLLNSRTPAPEAGVQVTLAQAVLKGDKMDDVIRDAVMLGVTAVQPVVTRRTELSLSSLERGHRLERWRRIAVSAVKQCGRAVLPDVLTPVTFDDLLDQFVAGVLDLPALLCVEPGAVGVAAPLTSVAREEKCTLIVGPEGGWTSAELAAASTCRLVTLGPRTIRADAMPLVALSALFATWKEF